MCAGTLRPPAVRLCVIGMPRDACVFEEGPWRGLGGAGGGFA